MVDILLNAYASRQWDEHRIPTEILHLGSVVYYRSDGICSALCAVLMDGVARRSMQADTRVAVVTKIMNAESDIRFISFGLFDRNHFSFSSTKPDHFIIDVHPLALAILAKDARSVSALLEHGTDPWTICRLRNLLAPEEMGDLDDCYEWRIPICKFARLSGDADVWKAFERFGVSVDQARLQSDTMTCGEVLAVVPACVMGYPGANVVTACADLLRRWL